MDAAAFRDRVESEKGTELDRLASNKLLLALTDAMLEEETVLRVAAESEHAARETFGRWAETEADEAAREAFETVAEQEATHYERVVGAMDDDGFEPTDPDGDGGPMHAYLRGRDDTVERIAAGMVGRSLVSVRAHTQVISFFINEADEKRADLFRDLKAETQETLERGLDLLESTCEDEDDWERARMVATYVVQVAYDDYADALSGMGMDPKPIC